MAKNITTNILSWFKNHLNISEVIDTEDVNLFEKPVRMCNFCTIGSKKYLTKVIALYNSLLKSGCYFHLWVLSMDEFSYHVLTALKMEHLHIISIKTLEEDNEILKAKEGKKENEYCWMLKAPLIEYVLSHEDVQTMLYVDSDLYFLKDPTLLFDNFEACSVYISPQRDMDYIEQKYGKYQAGLIGFKKDNEGMAALKF